MVFTAVIAVICAYLLGSINFAVVFIRAFINKDVRNIGSGNAGTTNAMRAGGKKVGILTFLCDFAKGVFSAFLGKIVFSYLFEITAINYVKPIYGAYICGFVCLIGHIWPLFFEFRGGKGVATGVGVFFVICPIASLIGLVAFTVCFLISRTVSLSSIIGTVSVVATALILYDKSAMFLPQLVMGCIMGIMVIVKHKDNIKKIIKGEENKFAKGKGKNG
ncbi:MAG: glycerol-3-phosphate 1-O-acyltransferase PlsY [Clostridia bacterium]|nr:glycerol-3-phosphate 1-O-acyltransferase PlsY [Clostridia bacterium]